MQILWITIGGIAGTLSRYSIIKLFGFSGFPWSTIIVNLTGSFCIGCLFVLSQHLPVSSALRAALQIGFLGAFTTFSAFTLDFLLLIEAEKIQTALLYFMISFPGGILLALIGWRLTKLIVT